MRVILFFLLVSLKFAEGLNAQQVKYFPVDSAEKLGFTSFVVQWYSRQLFAMKEPVLFNDKTNREVYRFTWLRTFHHPISIRIEKRGDSYLLFWKLCNGAGGYAPGKLVVDSQKALSKAVWRTFIAKVELTKFWSMETNKRELGMDGSEWILEGKENNKYHVVSRWTPSPSDDLYRCCDFLIQLTGLKIIGDEKY
jgi:hypothetical protein